MVCSEWWDSTDGACSLVWKLSLCVFAHVAALLMVGVIYLPFHVLMLNSSGYSGSILDFVLDLGSHYVLSVNLLTWVVSASPQTMDEFGIQKSEMDCVDEKYVL